MISSSTPKHRRATLLPRLALFAVTIAGSLTYAQNPGVANVSKLANSGFDGYTSGSSPSTQQWLRDHYYRMTVYSPYFDSKTSWYPRGIVYLNLYGILRDSALPNQHPEWILKDQSGNWLSVPWGCGGGTCPLWAGDVSNPDYRAWWVANARSILSKGYHGLWIDDVNMEFRVGDNNGNQVPPFDRNTGQVMTWDNWRRYVAEFLEQIRGSLPGAELTHNSIWYAGPGGVRDGDPYIQRQIAAADVINIEHGVASDAGLTGGTGIWSTAALLSYIDRVHARGRAVTVMEFSNDRAAQEYGLAGYFLVSTGKDQISDYATTPDNWWSGYSVNLGTPLGPYSYSNGLFRRDFTGGVVLLNEPGGGAKTINVGGGYSDLNGTGTQSVTLGARRAAILTKAGGAAPVAPPAPPSVSSQYLSDMNWTSAISAWGPAEKNTSNGEIPAGDGKPLRINGTPYAKGIGTHAYSEIHYALGGRCSGMSAVVGIDDEVPNGLGSVIFQVWADGVKLYDSGLVSRGAPALSVAADLSGRFDLSLIVNGADNGIDYDHADWADAKLTCNQ